MVLTFGLLRVQVDVRVRGSDERAAKRQYRHQQVLRVVEQEQARCRQQTAYRVY